MRPIIVAVAAGALLCACSSQDAQSPRIVAQVGDQIITVEDFEHEMALRAPMRPGYYESAGARRELLDHLIDRQVQLNAAIRAGIPEEPAFRDLVERMMIQRLREVELESALASGSVDDDEIEAYYQAHIDQFSRPERRQVALIRKSRPARHDDDVLAGLHQQMVEARHAALGIANEVAHFGAVAVNHSDDRGSRYQGGVIGWLVDGSQASYRLPAEVIDQAFALPEVGAISPVVETDEALWLVRLVALERPRRQPLAQVREGIRHRLTRARAEGLEARLIEQLRERETISVDEAALAAVPLPPVLPAEREPEPEPEPIRPPPLPGGSSDQTPAADDSGSVEYPVP
jgi:hypothetical protein